MITREKLRSIPFVDLTAQHLAHAEEIEVCLEGTAMYELKDPEWEVIATLEVHVGE